METMRHSDIVNIIVNKECEDCMYEVEVVTQETHPQFLNIPIFGLIQRMFRGESALNSP